MITGKGKSLSQTIQLSNKHLSINKIPDINCYIDIIPTLGLLDYQATKTLLLPRIKKVCVETNLLSVRVNGLVCIGKLLTHMDKWLVLDDILPMLQQIPSREPAVIMAIVGE